MRHFPIFYNFTKEANTGSYLLACRITWQDVTLMHSTDRFWKRMPGVITRDYLVSKQIATFKCVQMYRAGLPTRNVKKRIIKQLEYNRILE